MQCWQFSFTLFPLPKLCHSPRRQKGKMDSVLIHANRMQKKWGSNLPEEDILPWLLLLRRCLNFCSTLKEISTIFEFFLKDSWLWSLAQTLEPMQTETYEDTTDFKCTWQGNNSTQTQSKQTCCLWTHSCSVPLQQAWRVCQCTHLLCRGRKRTQNLGLCYEVSTALL